MGEKTYRQRSLKLSPNYFNTNPIHVLKARLAAQNSPEYKGDFGSRHLWSTGASSGMLRPYDSLKEHFFSDKVGTIQSSDELVSLIQAQLLEDEEELETGL